MEPKKIREQTAHLAKVFGDIAYGGALLSKSHYEDLKGLIKACEGSEVDTAILKEIKLSLESLCYVPEGLVESYFRLIDEKFSLFNREQRAVFNKNVDEN